MGALENAKVRYGATPRTIDRELSRLSRGDRGCLTDAISAAGALLTLVLVVLAYVDILPNQAIWLGAGLWVSGFAAGSVVQVRSGGRRRLALREGPLVYAQVVQAQAHLRSPDNGKRAGRAVVVFSTASDGALDRRRLAEVAQRLLAARQAAATRSATLDPRLDRLFTDPFALDMVPLDPAWVDASDYWCTQVVLYPDRLDQPRVEDDQVIALIVAPAAGFAEHVDAR